MPRVKLVPKTDYWSGVSPKKRELKRLELIKFYTYMYRGWEKNLKDVRADKATRNDIKRVMERYKDTIYLLGGTL